MNEPEFIDAATVAVSDQVMCNPEALDKVARALAEDLLPKLVTIQDKTYNLEPGAVGTWEVAKGFAGTVQQAHQATFGSLEFVTEQLQRVINDLTATAATVREADERAAGAVPRTR